MIYIFKRRFSFKFGTLNVYKYSKYPFMLKVKTIVL